MRINCTAYYASAFLPPHAEFPENVTERARFFKDKRISAAAAFSIATLHDGMQRADADPRSARKSLDMALSRATASSRESIRGNPMLHVNIIRKTEIVKERYRKK